MSASIIGPLDAQHPLRPADPPQDWGLFNGSLAAGMPPAHYCRPHHNPPRRHHRGHRRDRLRLGPRRHGRQGSTAAGAGRDAAGRLRLRAQRHRTPNRQSSSKSRATCSDASRGTPCCARACPSPWAGTAADQLGAQHVIGACALVMAISALAPLTLREIRQFDLEPDPITIPSSVAIPPGRESGDARVRQCPGEARSGRMAVTSRKKLSFE